MDEYDGELFDDSGEETEEDLNLNKELFAQAVTWGTDWTVETLVSQIVKGNIDLKPKFQRRNAWKIEKKSRLIESIILNLPVPEIILAESKEKKGSYLVIDGKQRLLTIKEFCSDKCENKDDKFKLKKLNVLHELIGKNYDDLSQESTFQKYKDSLDNQTIRTIVIKNWPNDTSFIPYF